MRHWFWLLCLLIGCGGPSFSPMFLASLSDYMKPPGLGGVPRVGGAPNPAGPGRWHGRIALVTCPRAPGERIQTHPAHRQVEEALRARNDDEVSAVGYVLEHSAGQQGWLQVTVLDWKTKVNLGTWVIQEWKTKPDFASAYPALLKKLKELHQ